ncbi:MAG: ParB/RepB/Spo0J family partition protein [Dermabacter sp.]|nr:ParB/RepB/Spo0J family partition protein [Dermabacter sp.]
MAKKRGGLGRGIGALIPSATPEDATTPTAEDAGAAAPEAPVTGEDAPTDAPDAAPSAASAAPRAEAADDAPSASPDAPASVGASASASSDAPATSSAGARPVDMFFSGDSASSSGSAASRASRDLADGWARDAQSKRRSTAAKKRAARPAPAAAEPAVPVAAQPAQVTAESPTATPASSPASAPSDVPADVPEAAATTPGLLPVPGAQFAEIPISEIRENPRNPRTVFDDDELNELAYSLREVGVLQPIVVRPVKAGEGGESFELVMGERRWRAAAVAGLSSIPAIVRSTTDDDLLRDALLENLHRSQLNPLEEAAAYGQLLEDFGCTQDELAERIGRSRPQISNTLRLLRLPPLVQRRLASGALSAGHARALVGLDDTQLQEELAQRIVAEGLSVRAVERLIAAGAAAGADARGAAPRRSTYNPRVVSLTSQLSTRFEAPVRIDVGKRKGKITLEFTNLTDLERLVERLGLSDG